MMLRKTVDSAIAGLKRFRTDLDKVQQHQLTQAIRAAEERDAAEAHRRACQQEANRALQIIGRLDELLT